MKTVRITPAIPKENIKLRVTAYCRVSTYGPAQLRILELQINTYIRMIQSHPDWNFAGVFFDIGKSGLRRSGRSGLDKMLKKAAKGKIDYIITKSISRVSRDTLEVLKIIRFLRERGINMHFENEGMDSIEIGKEFEITLRGMLAQDETRNTWYGDVLRGWRKEQQHVPIHLHWMKSGSRDVSVKRFVNMVFIRKLSKDCQCAAGTVTMDMQNTLSSSSKIWHNIRKIFILRTEEGVYNMLYRLEKIYC